MYYTPGRRQLQFSGTHMDQFDTPGNNTDLHGCCYFKYSQIFQGQYLTLYIPLQVTYSTLSKFHNNNHYSPLSDGTGPCAAYLNPDYA
jgi:hypothetical protein